MNGHFSQWQPPESLPPSLSAPMLAAASASANSQSLWPARSSGQAPQARIAQPHAGNGHRGDVVPVRVSPVNDLNFRVTSLNEYSIIGMTA